jgi:putative ABC transport system permease protein
MLDDYVYVGPRFNLLLFSVFAGFGLVLCLIRVYGVVATAAAQRTREIGVRLALGAHLHHVIGMLLNTGAKHVTLRVFIGRLGTVASVRVLGHWFETSRRSTPFPS